MMISNSRLHPTTANAVNILPTISGPNAITFFDYLTLA